MGLLHIQRLLIGLPICLLLTILPVPTQAPIPFVLPVAPTLTAAGAAGVAYLYHKSRCQWFECCHEKKDDYKYIRFGTVRTNLTETLDRMLFGQHIANTMLPKILHNHRAKSQSSKPLVISMHGLPGTGKTFTAHLLAQSLYEKGLESRFVLRIIANEYFHDEKKIPEYKAKLSDMLRFQLSDCKYSLIIFEDADKLFPELYEVIVPFISYHSQNGEAIFIFISNTGGQKIAKFALNAHHKGRFRKEIDMHELESLARNGAFNEEGGLRNSPLISHALIDHYVPFLPLERRHVALCVLTYIKEQYSNRRIDASIPDKVLDVLEYAPPDLQLYSVTGCKLTKQKVDILVD